MKKAACTIGFALAALSVAAQDGREGWESVASYRAERAVDHFAAQEKSTDPAVARAARFGRAVALLDLHPVTAAQLQEARGIFTSLAYSGADDVAQGARFFLGRIAQHHAVVPDLAEADRQFRQLITEHGDSLWAQTALSRLALLELYALRPTAPAAERVAAAEQLLGQARAPAAACELHYVIANAILFHRLPDAGALKHFVAAERLGRLGWNERREVLVQIGELSRLAGDEAQAAEYYRKFLTENPRDQRAYLIRERLEKL